MKFEPYPYQQYCIDRVIRQKAVGLFLDMGWGKTVITLTAIEKLIYDYCSVAKVLVIAPTEPAKNVWPEEVKKWDHLHDLKMVKVLGSQKARLSALSEEADIYVINRENVSWLVNTVRSEWPFDMVVIDELSSFKNSSSKRFRDLKKVRKYIRRIVGLTGTPAANGLMNLWSQVFLLDGGQALGKTITSYRTAYFYPEKYGPNGVVYSWAPREGAKEKIFSKISNLCLSLPQDMAKTMPETIYITRQTTLSDEQRMVYRSFKHDLVLNDEVTAATAAVLSNKLLQFASGEIYRDDHTVQHIHEAKEEVVSQLVEEANGEPVLIFYSYLHELDRLKKLFPEAVHIKEENAIERWNRKEISVLLANPMSAGHGLNLQYGGHIIVWFGLTWDLELYQQANKRLSRPGQTCPVSIFHIVVKDTIETKIIDYALKNKAILQNELLEFVKEEL